jgi:hypothetical protein
MPSKRYALERGGARRLEIAWQNPWKNMSIRLDGQDLGTIPSRQELLAGRQFALPDSSILKVQLVRRSIDTELHVLRNGRPVPGSYTDPLARYQLAYGVVLGITGAYLGLGMISVLTHSAFLQGIGVDTHSVILGAIFTLLAFYVKRRSAVGLGAAAVILIADGLAATVFAILGGRAPALLGLVIRGMLVFPMIDGIRAIRELKHEEEMANPPE